MFPDMFLRTSEEFYGQEYDPDGGLWTSAEESPNWPYSGLPILDYWGYDSDYKEKWSIMHVEKNFHKFLEKRGWYVEYYDTGTAMIYKS
jgi:hypothetical protein